MGENDEANNGNKQERFLLYEKQGDRTNGNEH
jgi:hypothetical protein